jgi:hypothetical protein
MRRRGLVGSGVHHGLDEMVVETCTGQREGKTEDNEGHGPDPDVDLYRPVPGCCCALPIPEEDQTAENRIKSNTKRIISSTRWYNPKMALINRAAQTTGGHSHADP